MEYGQIIIPTAHLQIVVQPFEDGTFRYLANSIEQKELELPVIARMNP